MKLIGMLCRVIAAAGQASGELKTNFESAIQL